LDVAVLGSDGFVGTAVCRSLGSAQGVCLRGFAVGDTDLRKADDAARAGREIAPGSGLVVVAAVSRDLGDTCATLFDNLQIARNVAEHVVPCAGQVVFLSTVDVYGRTNLALPLSEDSPANPEGFYAVSKYASEWILREACRRRGVPLAVLRMPLVYGPGDHPHRTIPSFVSHLEAGIPVRITGDGSQKRDPVFVGDVAAAVSAVLDASCGGVFNLTSGRAISLNGILDHLEKAAGKRFMREFDGDLSSQVDLVFQTSRLLEKVEGFSFTEPEEGLQRTYEYFAA